MTAEYEGYLSALGAAVELYRSDPVQGRIAAVKVAAQYLREMKVDLTLITPLYDVIGHLEDERLGRVGNSKPIFEHNQTVLASIAITFTNKAGGRNLKQSGAVVAQAAGLNAKDILQDRKNLMDGKAHRDAIDLHDRLIDEANASGKTPGQLAAHAIDKLREKTRQRS
jgi:hypothetical protein